ncbi:MAG: biopolymer transporter ExbD [Acidobacteria bacterium]|nr:biopolymer transporter ExbD [Acidobacteriota bacterium]
MSMSTGGSKGGIKADINVTPLVDIMLVLLIIMMLIAPLLQKGVNVQLPLADNTTEKPDTQDQTVVAVDSQRQLFVNSIPVSEREAVDRIKFALEEKAERIVYLKGDTDAPYGAIMSMMDKLREAGIENVALITETRKKADAGGN